MRARPMLGAVIDRGAARVYTGCGKTLPICHSECTGACGPPKEMKIAVLVTPAQAGVHVRTEETGFPLPAFAGTGFAGMTGPG